jgi:major membrane immunogen (membrane-anchored lipoprotein)
MVRRGVVGLLCLGLLNACGQSDHDKLQNWLTTTQSVADKAKFREFISDFKARINSDSSDERKISDIQSLGMEEEKYLDAHVLSQPPQFSGSNVQEYAVQYYLASTDARKSVYQMAKDFIYISKYEACCQIQNDIAAVSQATSRVKETKQRLMISAGFTEIEQNQNLQ